MGPAAVICPTYMHLCVLIRSLSAGQLQNIGIFYDDFEWINGG